MLREILPPGFRTASSASGLIVPEDTPREREVWLRDEWKLIDRATKLLQARGVRFQFACTDARCTQERMELIRQPSGDVILRCNHKDRVWSKTH